MAPHGKEFFSSLKEYICFYKQNNDYKRKLLQGKKYHCLNFEESQVKISEVTMFIRKTKNPRSSLFIRKLVDENPRKLTADVVNEVKKSVYHEDSYYNKHNLNKTSLPS